MKIVLDKSIKEEKGQALILVLILLLVGGLMLTPLLGFMGSGLIVGQVYEKKADELYAADAGIEDALWKIDRLDYTTATDSWSINGVDADAEVTFDNLYDYETPWPYLLDDIVNSYSVDVTIENIWIPNNIPVPSASEAEDIVKAGKLIVTGSANEAPEYQINITYAPEEGEEDGLSIVTLGIWLPPGYTYDEDGACNLEGYYTSRDITPYASGQAVVWTFSSYPFAGNDMLSLDPFPGVDPEASPMVSTITFQYDTENVMAPDAIAWVTTGVGDSPPYAWDADLKVYKIISTANDTEVEAYAAKRELRELVSTIPGDYKAIGNSLMTDEVPDSGGPDRETLWPESDAEVNNIPDDAEVRVAYLYWSGWLEEGAGTTIWQDDCSSMSNWLPGTDWDIYSDRLRGHHRGGENDRGLDMQQSLDLSSYAPGTVTISWDQDEDGYLEDSDRVYFSFFDGSNWGPDIEAFRNDNPPSSFSYTIPDEYLTNNFRIKFHLNYFGGSGEYAYLDNIEISAETIETPETIADTTAIFKINEGLPGGAGQVCFEPGDPPVPTQGVGELTADSSQVVVDQNYRPGTFFYACKKDVTELVKTFSAKAPDPATNHPGNAIYTVGGVDATWDADSEIAYAGWSLIIIYSNKLDPGHQLYLYDTFVTSGQNNNLDFDNDGQPGGTISGFLVPDRIYNEETGEWEENAAKVTCFVGEGDDYYNGDYLRFNGTKLWDGITTGGNSVGNPDDVWNNQSLGMSADGVDVDTFYVTWASDLLEAGETSAQIDLWTDTDIWELVYIILSFRSLPTTGGTMTYLIR